jgi:hypothetical protein
LRVESFVRKALDREFGVHFEPRVLTLTTGGTHEFDAVSKDQKIVATIKSASGRTVSGRIPSGKIRAAEAELYYLTLVTAVHRLLVLTTPEFYEIMQKRLTKRLAPGISLKLVRLPGKIRTEVERVQRNASNEVSGERRIR